MVVNNAIIFLSLSNYNKKLAKKEDKNEKVAKNEISKRVENGPSLSVNSHFSCHHIPNTSLKGRWMFGGGDEGLRKCYVYSELQKENAIKIHQRKNTSYVFCPACINLPSPPPTLLHFT